MLKRRLVLHRVGALVLADLRAEDVSELGQLLTSGLPGNLLGDRLGRVQSGRVERHCYSRCSVKYVGLGHQSESVCRQ